MGKIILASKSPRRIELLKMLGLNVEISVSELDESGISADTPAQLTEKLAKMKAEDVYRALRPENSPVIAADTLVELSGKALGKPRSFEEAREMLSSLSGRFHEVHTGIAVICKGVSATSVETARVRFRELSIDEIESYIMTGEPMDKAGAYGIQSRGSLFVDRIEGDYFTVVGLPVCSLAKLMRDRMGLNLLDYK